MRILILFWGMLIVSWAMKAQEPTEQELRLYNMINDYRAQHGLPAIPLSKSLTYVAQQHAKDLHINRPFTTNCNMHSWSAKGAWSSCCYTSDHKQADCMWNKPREMTGYQGNGYEISHGYSNYASYAGYDVTPESSLNGWKSSPGHNAVILNQNIWQGMRWKAIGIGMYKDFSVVWFGTEADDKPFEIKQFTPTQQVEEKNVNNNQNIGLQPSMQEEDNQQKNPYEARNITNTKKKSSSSSSIDIRDRVAVRLGLGVNYLYGDIAAEPRDFDGKVFSPQFHGMIGYRFKENYHQHSNIFGIFLNYSSNTRQSSSRYLDASQAFTDGGISSGDSSSRNIEVEFGFLGREWFRMTGGFGNVKFKNATNQSVSANYYILTPGFDVGIKHIRFYIDLPLLFGKDFENVLFRPSFGIVGQVNFLHK
ncbi:MAG: hypothetical protein OHK0038_25530 [Flammeovirgaceae bacterium]